MHGKPYKNTNCCFRCISYHLNGNSEKNIKRNVMQLTEQFRKYVGIPLGKFTGEITMDLLFQIELCFGLKISVYSLIPKYDREVQKNNDTNTMVLLNPRDLDQYEAKLICGSSIKSCEAKNCELFLDLTMDHLSLITSIENYANSFSCKTCKKLFKKRYQCTRHQKKCFKEDVFLTNE